MSPRPLFVLLALSLTATLVARDFNPIRLTPPTPRRRSAGNRVDLTKPTMELPCRWQLPSGWNAFKKTLADGGVVAYVSGQDPNAFARVYSWPVDRASDRAQEAQRKLLQAFETPILLDLAVPWREEILLTLWGSSEGDIREMDFQKKMPDVAYKARVGRVGDRLVAAVFGVRKPEDEQARPLVNARQMLDRLEWQMPWSYANSYAGWR